MSIQSIKASAPGKVILLGEHAVVRGKDAVVCAIDRRIEVKILVSSGSGVQVNLQSFNYLGPLTPSNEDELSDSVRNALLGITQAARLCNVDLNACKYDIEVTSSIPSSKGMGSSAALSVSLIAAFLCVNGHAKQDVDENVFSERVFKEAWRLEEIFHGTSSGVDPAAATFGGVLRYNKGKRVWRLSDKHVKGSFMIIDSGEARSTRQVNEELRARELYDPDKYAKSFNRIDEIVDDFCRDKIPLEYAIRLNQTELEQMDLMTGRLKLIKQLAESHGHAIKITGAGRGGSMIAYSEQGFSKMFIEEMRRLVEDLYLLPEPNGGLGVFVCRGNS